MSRNPQMSQMFYSSVPYLFLRAIGSPVSEHVSQVTNHLSPSHSGHFLRRKLDRVNDMRVARATTQIAFQRVSDLRAIGIGSPIEQLDTGHDHARGAITALETVAFPKPFLHGM